MVARTLLLGLIFSLSINAFGQTEASEDSLLRVRRQHLEQLSRSQNFDSVRQVQFEMEQVRAADRLKASYTLDRSTKKLVLSNLDLTKLPKHISEFDSITRLELQGNRLKTIPKKVLSKVKYLDLSNNPLNARKFRFKRNHSIKYLVLDKNQLARLPRSIKKLKTLDEISLKENHFNRFPERASRIKLLTSTDLSLNPINPKINLKRPSTTITTVIFNSCNLTQFPVFLLQMPQLENIQLNRNKIMGLPENIDVLKKLTRFTAYINEIESIPAAFYKLENLEIVDLYFNKIKIIAPAISQMRKLNILYLSNNELYSLPEEIGELDNLEMLFLHHNKLSYLPSSIDKLQNLEVLHINHNRFQEFPRQILSLKKLKDLDFSNNDIVDLPYELTSLDKLYLLFIQQNPYDEEAKETLESLMAYYEGKEISFNY